MKIALYTRVSSQLQEKENTIDSQISELELYAKVNDYIVIDQYLDKGYSGNLLARPALDRLRDDASKGIFEAVLIHSPDRLARRYVYQEIVIEELKNKNIQVIFKNRRIAETPEDQLLLGVQGIVAEYERAKIAERTRRGKLHRAKLGLLVGNVAPYGYKYVKKNDLEERHYQIVEVEADNVKLIFNSLAYEHLTLRRIIKKLYELKIYTKNGKKTWATSTLSRLMRREDYIGTAYYNKSISLVPKNVQNKNTYKRVNKSSRKDKPRTDWLPFKIPSIIDKETFTLAQKQLKKNQVFSARNKKRSYLLSGLMYCGKCKSKYSGDTNTKCNNFKYYRSNLRLKIYPLKPNCVCKNINGIMIENLIWAEIRNLLNKPKLIEKHYKLWKDKHFREKNIDTFKLDNLNKELNKLQDVETKLIDGYTAGIIPLDQLKTRLSVVKLKRITLEQSKNKIQTEFSTTKTNFSITPELIHKKFSFVLSNLDEVKKEQIVHSVLKEIVIENNKATIRGFIPIQSDSSEVLRSIDDKGRNAIPQIEFEIIKKIPKRYNP